MTFMGNQTGQSGDPARENSKSGSYMDFTAVGVPFYSTQRYYLLEPLTNYGWCPSNSAYLVQIWYAPYDAPKGRVAGMISVANEELTDYFDDGTYRVGVSASKVRDSLTYRIDAAKKLLSQGGAEKLAETAMGREAVDNLEGKVARLNHCLADLDELARAGWTHLVLATGWQEPDRNGRELDRLDLNDDFFSKFYPLDAFPLAGLTSGATWVHRDYFLRELLPEGFMVTTNRAEGQVVTCSKYPRLKITFNLVRHDLLDEKTGKKAKLVGTPSWPTVEDVVKKVTQNLNANYLGKDGDKARKEAYRWAAKFMKRELDLRKRKKTKEADLNGKACKDLFDAVAVSLMKENKKVYQDFKNIKDPLSKDVMKVTKELLNNLADQMMNPSLDPERVQEQANSQIEEAADLQQTRANKQGGNLKNVDPLSTQYIKDLTETFRSSGNALSGGSSAQDTSMADISFSYVEGMKKLIDQSVWRSHKFWWFYHNNYQIAEPHVLPPEYVEKGMKKNLAEMEREFKRQPGLNKNERLVNLIRIHMRAFNQKVPDYMLTEPQIAAYVNGIEESMKPLPPPPVTFTEEGEAIIEFNDPRKVLKK
jgi:hypothetical protein